MKINREENRGKGDYGWLKANYSFSFSDYYNPDKMGFGKLRVINEDFIAPNSGFQEHGHKNMEILTIVLDGELTHTDSLGNKKVLKPGRIQRMYAGSGIRHSEFNDSKVQQLNLLQIWIEPHTFNLKPEYIEKSFDFNQSSIVLASSSGKEGSIRIYQNMEVRLINLKESETFSFDGINKSLYLHTIKGELSINNDIIRYGDSIESFNKNLEISAKTDSLLLAFTF